MAKRTIVAKQKVNNVVLDKPNNLEFIKFLNSEKTSYPIEMYSELQNRYTSFKLKNTDYSKKFNGKNEYQILLVKFAYGKQFEYEYKQLLEYKNKLDSAVKTVFDHVQSVVKERGVSMITCYSTSGIKITSVQSQIWRVRLYNYIEKSILEYSERYSIPTTNISSYFIQGTHSIAQMLDLCAMGALNTWEDFVWDGILHLTKPVSKPNVCKLFSNNEIDLVLRAPNIVFDLKEPVKINHTLLWD